MVAAATTHEPSAWCGSMRSYSLTKGSCLRPSDEHRPRGLDGATCLLGFQAGRAAALHRSLLVGVDPSNSGRIMDDSSGRGIAQLHRLHTNSWSCARKET